MFRKLFYLVSCVVLLSISLPAKADLVVTNGDFEANAGPSIPDVTDWYDNNAGGFWEDAWQSNDSWITPNGSQVVIFCSWDTVEGDPLAGSYLYQSIGTSTGESSITIGFDWGHPDDVAADRHDGLTVSVLASDGSFVADDANDVLGADGITLLDYASYDHVALGTDGEIFPVVVTLDLSGANAGDEIFLRFNNYMPEAGADPWPVLDNVEIQVTSVDDPSDMADSSGDIKRIEAWMDEGNLNLTMTVYGVFAPSVEETPAGMTNRYYYHWLLDTDNNPDTGMNNSEYEGNATNLETPIGADVVVMLGWRDGNPNGVEVYDALTEDILLEDYEYTIDGDTIHAVIPLEYLGLEPGQTIAVSAFQEGASNDWQCDWVESFELTFAAEPEPEPEPGPILKLDINNAHVPEETEEGFTSFTLADSGTAVNGITIEFAGINASDSRRRGEPTGVPFENIYRDFIFGRQSEAGVGYVSVTLSGLTANETYEITLYSWDISSTGIRIADWTANSEPLFTTIHDGNVEPPASEDDYAYTATAVADENGVILMEAVPGEGTFAAEPFAFINALVVSIPIVPVDPGTENLVHSWTFDDGTASDIVGNADGTLVGDAAVVDGQLVLDGNGDWMDMPGDVIAMNTFEGLTIEVQFTSVAGGNTGFHMVTAFGEEGTGDNPGFGYKYVCITPARGDNVSRAMIQTVSMDNDPWSEETGVSDVVEHDDGLPHHMVCTIDDTELAFYVDGVLIGTAALDPPGNSIAGIGTAVARIGKGVYGVDPLWAGSVDYLNLYNRALSEGEILYLAGFGQNLVLNPSFEEDEAILDDPDWYSWATWNPAEGAGSNATIVDTDAVDGARSLLIEPIGPENWHFIVVGMPIPTDVGTSYTASFWAKAAEPRPLGAQWKAVDNSESWGYTDFDLTTEWAEYSLTAEALNAETKLEFFCAASEVSFLLDAVSVTKE